VELDVNSNILPFRRDSLSNIRILLSQCDNVIIVTGPTRQKQGAVHQCYQVSVVTF